MLPESSSAWKIAFSMQHHGLPTRLLDWTESFATALYFALNNADRECCVWILNPFELNKSAINNEKLTRPDDLKANYDDYFIYNNETMEGNAIAVSPLRHHPRVFQQRGGFTIHDDLSTPLEEIHPNALSKIPIPQEAFNEARNFLKLSGISEYSLFPDLDGLERELYSELFKK